MYTPSRQCTRHLTHHNVCIIHRVDVQFHPSMRACLTEHTTQQFFQSALLFPLLKKASVMGFGINDFCFNANVSLAGLQSVKY